MLNLPTLAAEPIFHIGSFPITNTYINSCLAVLVFAVFGYFLNRSAKKQYPKAPRGVVNFMEWLLEFVLGYIDGVTKDRKKSLKFLPIVGTIFFFILFSNWIGLIPGHGQHWHSPRCRIYSLASAGQHRFKPNAGHGRVCGCFFTYFRHYDHWLFQIRQQVH